MNDSKTWTPLVITAFLHIQLHEQSSLPNLLNLKNQPIEKSKAHTNHPFQIHKPPASPTKVNPHIHKSHSPMRIITPQPSKISSQFQSHHINPITQLKVPQLRIERTLCCLSPPYFSSIQNQLILQGWVSP